MLTHADRDHGVDGGIDVDLVTVFEVALALHALWRQPVYDVLDLVRDRFVLEQDAVYFICVTLGCPALVNRRPVGPVQLHLVVPLLVMVGRRDRFLAPHVVETNGGFAHLALPSRDVVGAASLPVKWLEGPDDAVVVAIGQADRFEDTKARYCLAICKQLEQLEPQFA